MYYFQMAFTYTSVAIAILIILSFAYYVVKMCAEEEGWKSYAPWWILVFGACFGLFFYTSDLAATVVSIVVIFLATLDYFSIFKWRDPIIILGASCPAGSFSVYYFFS